MFMAFDLLHQDGVDLRHAPGRAQEGSRSPLPQDQDPLHGPGLAVPRRPGLVWHGAKFGFEGVVSKRLDRRYVSGPAKSWLKIKCPGWKRDNQERFSLFEGRGC